MPKSLIAAVLAVVLCGVAEAGSQTVDEARQSIERKAKIGDRLTIRTSDGTEFQGRLRDLGTAGAVIDGATGARSFNYSEIDRVRRRKNGVMLGTIIGAAAGLAVGLPLRELTHNEVGGGGGVLALCVAGGVGAGLGLDAAFGSNRTIYQRPRSARSSFDLQPQKGGATLRWTASW